MALDSLPAELVGLICARITDAADLREFCEAYRRAEPFYEFCLTTRTLRANRLPDVHRSLDFWFNTDVANIGIWFSAPPAIREVVFNFEPPGEN